jgi:hypothetical protein
VQLTLEHHIEHPSLLPRSLGGQEFLVVVVLSDTGREEASNLLGREFAEERQLPEAIRLEPR